MRLVPRHRKGMAVESPLAIDQAGACLAFHCCRSSGELLQPPAVADMPTVGIGGSRFFAAHFSMQEIGVCQSKRCQRLTRFSVLLMNNFVGALQKESPLSFMVVHDLRKSSRYFDRIA